MTATLTARIRQLEDDLEAAWAAGNADEIDTTAKALNATRKLLANACARQAA